jgi:trans-2,3-dihydro-3-hydroxyanthranilate isomerase
LPSVDLVAKALSLEPRDIGFENHGIGVHQGGPRFFHVPLKSREAVARCVVAEPHWSAMITALGVDNAYVYARGGDSPKANFRARMFAPTGGIPEDPATGSATALLAAQLLKAEALKDGTHKWQLEQGYEMGRPSDLFLEVDVAGGALKAVRVAGQAVKVMQGTLEI